VRIRLTIEYDGTPFRGWAVQPGERTVEGALREALGGTFDSFEKLAVAGRTDAGVHALGQVASVDVSGGPPVERIAAALNTRLPHEISVAGVEEAPTDFSARFSARSRTYRYRVFNRRTCSPFERSRSWWIVRTLDEDSLVRAAALLRGAHDFRAFTPAATEHRGFTRTIEHAEWVRRGDHLDFEITADSFLRHMVRSLVGTMVDGPELEPLLAGADRAQAGPTAPPHGLYLVSVAY
jgi:tRNA pseudouridine38-40 synthase